VNNVVIYTNDHLGTPQKLTAVNGAVVWGAKYASFGAADVDIPSAITNNLRFPGQYYDQETGLHYNWHRYYDPKTGRYLIADPIGFEGGVNLYAYVLNNSINHIDVLGLWRLCSPWIATLEIRWIPTGNIVGGGERILPSNIMLWILESLIMKRGSSGITSYGTFIEHIYYEEEFKERKYIRGCIWGSMIGCQSSNEVKWKDTGKRRWKLKTAGIEFRRWDDSGPAPRRPEA